MNGASGAAPQQGIAAPDRAPDFLFLLIYFSLFLMVHQVLLHNKESRHQTGNQTFFLFTYFFLFI
jgi:hypothetical protein